MERINKKIIISEEDFNSLQEKAEAFDKYGETNIHFVHLEISQGITRYHTKDNCLSYKPRDYKSTISELKETLPADLKKEIEIGLKRIDDIYVPMLNENKDLEEDIKILKNKIENLKKIPVWIRKIFTYYEE